MKVVKTQMYYKRINLNLRDMHKAKGWKKFLCEQ